MNEAHSESSHGEPVNKGEISGRKLVAITAVGGLLVGLGVYVALQPNTPKFDHLVVGRELRGSNMLQYQAGIVTRCVEYTHAAATINLSISLSTEEKIFDKPTTPPRGRVINAFFMPGPQSCAQAEAHVFDGASDATTAVGYIEDNVGALSYRIFGDGEFAPGTSMLKQIVAAEHHGVPTTHAHTLAGTIG
ncbi:MAG TPA: hypothetical protein VIH90_02970 [Candidatus Saccharimonadales bacterium]